MSLNTSEEATKITLADVATIPWPGMAIPGSISFSPDDRLITYLFSSEGTLERQLIAFDPETRRRFSLVTGERKGVSEEKVDLEEALRRERRRQRETGVTRYSWAKKGQRILIPLEDGLYVLDDPISTPRHILSTDSQPAIDARLSPDSEWVSYVQDAEVHVIPTNGGDPLQLTFGARGTGKTHGLAEYIAQEEMHRMRGYWWSGDSDIIAFTEVDENHIPVYRIVHQGNDSVGEVAQEDHRYPFAGMENARIRLGVVSVNGGDPVWMDLDQEEDIYLARVKWLPNGRLSAQVQNRQQTILYLISFDPLTGERRHLSRERSDSWINLHKIFRPLQEEREDGGTFIWASERSGFRHLYLMDKDGEVIRPLTGGDWVVDDLAGIDEEKGQLFFTASRENPLERHLYRVSLDGGRIQRISEEPGIHSVVLDHACRRYIDIHQALEKPPAIVLRSLSDNRLLSTVYDQVDPRIDNIGLCPPEPVALENRVSVLLYGLIYHPPAGYGPGPFPTLVSVYGGPHAQSVANSWGPTANLRAQYLSNQGFLVFVLDNRGSARRGLAFESAVKNNLGFHEVEDQVDGVKWLIDKGLADPDRVGIFGWSYGGYMACMCLARAPGTFKAAVAGAPVTHWDGYDTHYTERYMDTPKSNPTGYLEGSVMKHVDNIRGSLMLVHGLIDENVHFRHTARLINALIAANKSYELLLFPDARHGSRKKADQIYLEEHVCDFFLRNI